MRGIAVVRASVRVILTGVIIWCFAPFSYVAAQPASTTIGATICAGTSSITLATPLSDSVVTDPNVPLGGTVDQAGQIEVYVDGALDHIIPLSVGQTTYSGSVELMAGTHTIKVTAVNVCSGTDASASSVVTYAPPPPSVTPSTGQTTPTDVENGQSSGGVVVTPDNQAGTTAPPALLPENVTMQLNHFLGWLNINISDSTKGHALSLWRAVVITGGLYLVVVGMAAKVVWHVARTKSFTAMVPYLTDARRGRWVAWAFRGLGLIIIAAALFL